MNIKIVADPAFATNRRGLMGRLRSPPPVWKALGSRVSPSVDRKRERSLSSIRSICKKCQGINRSSSLNVLLCQVRVIGSGSHRTLVPMQAVKMNRRALLSSPDHLKHCHSRGSGSRWRPSASSKKATLLDSTLDATMNEVQDRSTICVPRHRSSGLLAGSCICRRLGSTLRVIYPRERNLRLHMAIRP